MDDVRLALMSGTAQMTGGSVRPGEHAALPFIVVDDEGRELPHCSEFLRDVTLGDASRLTIRSYAHDLLRWTRLLRVVGVAWDRATCAEVELLVGWMRLAVNSQRLRGAPLASVNQRTGKPQLAAGYAASSINHNLSVLSSFYDFHARFADVVNPVPANAARRRRLAHLSPIAAPVPFRRAPLRQRGAERAPRSIPDGMVDELIGSMGNARDRALLVTFLSSGARASELLGVVGGQLDWDRQQMWVVSKGSRVLEPVPVSPTALRYLAIYFDRHGTPTADEPVFRTLRGGTPRALSHSAARRVLQRANDQLGTNWTLHDLRHTTISRMLADPQLSLPEVMAVTRHKAVTSLTPYLRPRVEEMFVQLQAHYDRPAQPTVLSPGYRADDFEAVFGARRSQ